MQLDFAKTQLGKLQRERKAAEDTIAENQGKIEVIDAQTPGLEAFIKANTPAEPAPVAQPAAT